MNSNIKTLNIFFKKKILIKNKKNFLRNTSRSKKKKMTINKIIIYFRFFFFERKIKIFENKIKSTYRNRVSFLLTGNTLSNRGIQAETYILFNNYWNNLLSVYLYKTKEKKPEKFNKEMNFIRLSNKTNVNIKLEKNQFFFGKLKFNKKFFYLVINIRKRYFFNVPMVLSNMEDNIIEKQNLYNHLFKINDKFHKKILKNKSSDKFATIFFKETGDFINNRKNFKKNYLFLKKKFLSL